MKPEVLNALLTARTLFDTARLQCFVRDRHVASAGLIVLQDALELVLYACLLEVGADEKKNIESLSFDQLIGELKSQNLKVPKSGTLKAMNKQRVVIKHHAQLAEPISVQNYYEASALAADTLLTQVAGKPLQHIVIADAISRPELVGLINEASSAIESGKYFDAMISIRKLLFLAVEREYDIRQWAEYDPTTGEGRPIFSGMKAPWYTKDRDWIHDNVNEPTDYVQLDHNRIRTDMLELGMNPEEFFNVWRLTPKVYHQQDNTWAVRSAPRNEAVADEDSARYCLDVVISILFKQQFQSGLARDAGFACWRARILRDQPLLTRACESANEAGTVHIGDIYEVESIVSVLDGKEDFVELYRLPHKSLPYIHGFVPRDSCEIEDYTNQLPGSLVCHECRLFNEGSRSNCERCGAPLEKREARHQDANDPT